MNDETNMAGAGDSQQENLIRIIDADDILRGDRAVLLRFNDKTYRLQVTVNGKLILTK